VVVRIKERRNGDRPAGVDKDMRTLLFFCLDLKFKNSFILQTKMCLIKNKIIIASILLVIICKLNDAASGRGRRGGNGSRQEHRVNVSFVTLNLRAEFCGTLIKTDMKTYLSKLIYKIFGFF